MLPGFAVLHARTGVSALNVVTAGLEVDARTRGCDVRFAKGADALVEEVRSLARENGRVVVGWSLPGTPLRDAVPAPVSPELEAEVAHLESRGAAHGQWRRQLVSACNLVRRNPDPD